MSEWIELVCGIEATLVQSYIVSKWNLGVSNNWNMSLLNYSTNS